MPAVFSMLSPFLMLNLQFCSLDFALSLLMCQFLLLNSLCLLDMLSNHPLLLQSFHLKSQDLLRDLRNAGGVAAGSAGVSAGTPRSSAELREAVEVAKS